ncbi:MAG: PAS domain S-box protein [Methanoregula sp.]|nr:PAS domain S-box protein [Methanoregula sp.]
MTPDAIRVLYVDDEPELLEIGRLFLEKDRAFTVDTLASARQALEHLKTERYDAIISDYQMPEMDGLLFLKQLKSSGNATPFIIFTGRGREEVVIEAFNEGADFYIQKGGEPKSQFAELSNKIRYAVMRKQAEDALRESDERYRSVVNDQTEMIARFTPAGVITFVNEAYRSYFTSLLDFPEILGKNIREVMQVKNYAEVEKFLRSFTQKAPLREMGRMFTAHDGTNHWQIWSVRALFSPEGNPAEYQVVGRDVTGQKRSEEELLRKNEELGASYEQIAATEEELRQQLDELTDKQEALRISEEKFRAFTENIPDLTTITDPSGIYIYVSPSIQRIAGRSSEEFLGKTIVEMEAALGISPEDIGLIRKCGRMAMQKPGVTLPVPPFQGHDPEGRIFYFEGTVTHLPDVKGIEGVIFHGRDITDRIHAEMKLRESDTRYRHFFESFDDVYYQTDTNGLFTILSPSVKRFTGWTPEELIQKPSTILYVNPGEKPALLEEIAKNGYVSDYELLLQKRDGTPIPVSLTAHRISNADGTPAGVAGILRDITRRKHADDELRRSRQRYQAVVEDQTEFICLFQPDGTHVFVNDAYCRYFGKGREEIIGSRFRPKIHPDDAAAVRRFFSTLTPANPVDLIEHRIILPDGSIRWLRWSDRAIFDPAGGVIEYQSVGRDITLRKEAEIALEKSEQRNAAIIAAIPDTLMILSREGVFLDYHTKDEKFLAIDPKKILGTNIRDFGISSETVDMMLQTIALTIDTGTPQEIVYDLANLFNPRQFEARLVKLDESRVMMVVRDITEYNRMLEALKESEVRLNSIVKGSPMLQFVIDKDHRVISWNRAIEEYSGITEAEVIGTQDAWRAFSEIEQPVLADLLVDEKVERLSEWYQGKIKKSRLVEGAYEVTDFFPGMGPAGTWLYFTAAPIRDSRGIMIGAVETLEDITERKSAEDALLRANEKLTMLNSITRHDILNQLMGLRTYLELSKETVKDPVLLRYIGKEEQAAEAIQEQIEFTRNYQDIGAQAPKWQSLPEIIGSAVRQLKPQDIVVNIAVYGEEIFADPLIEKVFYNLMENSLRHGGPVTRMDFSVEEKEGGLVLTYADNGMGITADDKKNLFKKGFGKHTGLGLFLSKEILSITGIAITENGEPGKGVRFEITVPKDMWRPIANST